MKVLITSLIAATVLLLSSCQTLGELGLAAGGAAAGSLLGPGGAALGAAGGILVADTLIPENTPHAVGDIAAGQPQGTTASTLHEVHQLVTSVGWWYLLLFVLLPFLTKRGRAWFVNFTRLHDSVSKKDVELQLERLNRLEEIVSSQPNGNKK